MVYKHSAMAARCMSRLRIHRTTDRLTAITRSAAGHPMQVSIHCTNLKDSRISSN